MRKEWVLPDKQDDRQVQELMKAHQLNALVAELLVRRGYASPEDAGRFLSPDFSELHDPLLMRHMPEAVQLLRDALHQQKRVVILGDYDVDGVTGTALLLDFFRSCGFQDLGFFIPNRVDHGYGLTPASAAEVAAMKPDLVVTVDNGITAGPETADLEAQGMTVLVTDHHLADPQKLPQGLVLNPNHPQCDYPFKKISGCGVALKLAMALRRALREEGWWNADRPEPNLRLLLDLAALGTVADVVPLVDENRVMVHHGLKVLNEGHRLAFRVLQRLKQVPVVTAQTLGWKYGPLINAVGRLQDAAPAVHLLLSADEDEALGLAEELDAINLQRRELGDEMLEAAMQMASGQRNQRGVVVFHPEFHEGVNGIVAARLVERLHKPVVVFSESNGLLKGSGRSIPELHLKDAFDACAEHLARYGGHAAAAGCSVHPDQLEAFQTQFAEVCARRLPHQLTPKLELDGRVDPGQLSLGLVQQLQRLEPFGAANPEPLFACPTPTVPFQTLKEKHVKWQLGESVEMIGWNLAEPMEHALPDQLAVTLGINEFRGRRKVQLMIREAV